jgi:hypothetical protein
MNGLVMLKHLLKTYKSYTPFTPFRIDCVVNAKCNVAFSLKSAHEMSDRSLQMRKGVIFI